MKKATPLKITFQLFCAFTSLAAFSACSTTGMMSGTGKGWIYTDIKEGELVTANQAGKKRGTACASNILGLFATGDASIGTAMKDGAITIVSSVDHSSKGILFLWGRYCTIVTGI